MKILGIETSCDETATAIVEDGTKILSSIIASSVEMHAKTGGIIPEVAAREQVKCIIPVVEEAIKQLSNKVIKKNNPSITQLLNYSITEIDAIAVTVGPGLIGSLLVGVETAKTLAYAWQKPIIPVNHLLAHIYANWLTLNPPSFPLICLVVSGGHTDLVLMKNHNQIKWLGGTRDDAAGECFDKCARLLGLGYPGGPAIAAAAAKQLTIKQYSNIAIKLPRPMINDKNFDFSFSGLKTAVIREVGSWKLEARERSEMLEENKFKFSHQNLASHFSLHISSLAYEIQEAIVDVLVFKTLRAAEKFKVKSILLAGGVAANSRLREKFSSHPLITNYQLLIPKPSLCTDNAAMVASCAYFNHVSIPWQKITTQPGLTITGEV